MVSMIPAVATANSQQILDVLALLDSSLKDNLVFGQTLLNQRKPNMLQNAAAQLFNELNSMREDIQKQNRHIQALSKVIQRKLNL